MKEKLFVSTLDVDGYDLVVVGTSKLQNRRALLQDARKMHKTTEMSVIREMYLDEIRHNEVEEFGKVIWP